MDELKTCFTCNKKIPSEPNYKKQCLDCYINNYKICYNCKQKKSNSYSLCFGCNKLDRLDRMDRYVKSDLDFGYKICKDCNYEKTFNGHLYCFGCYIHNH